MKDFVLDSFALLSYCEGEVGAREVATFFKKALVNKVRLFLSVVNWGELYYIALREGGIERAELYRSTIARYPIKTINAGFDQTLQAALFKGAFRMSYADAYAAALAKLRGATLITGDNEFAPLEKEIRIHWIAR